MIVERQAGEIIIRINDNFDDNELESMLDYIRYKEVKLLSKSQQFEIEKLADEVNTNIWEHYKQNHNYNLFVPDSVEEYLSLLKIAEEDIEKGDVITLDELKLEIEKW